MTASIHDKVSEFHRALNLPVRQVPCVPDEDRLRLRLRLVAEEFFELVAAAGIDIADEEEATLWAVDNYSVTEPDLVEMADALADMAYVVEGANLEFGIDGADVLDEVHRSNMEKVGGPRRADGKAMKPKGWRPPDVLECLIRQGWRGHGA